MGFTRAVVAGLGVGVALACGGAGGPEVVPAPEAAPPEALVAIDRLFEGMERGCAGNKRLQRALDSMATSLDDGATWRPGGAVAVPDAVKPLFGASVLIGGDEEHSLFAVEVTGASWLGLPVRRLDTWVGHRNGLSGYAVVVDGALADVEATMRGALRIVDSCVDDAECLVGPHVMEFSAIGEAQTRVLCATPF